MADAGGAKSSDPKMTTPPTPLSDTPTPATPTPATPTPATATTLAPIAMALAGKRLFVTGATGFLGTALIERLLRSVPDATVTVLIRPTRRLDPTQRANREIVRNDCFDRLREELGDAFDSHVGARLSAVAGDVSQDGLGLDDVGRQALAEADIVIHSAATVAFDAAYDSAIEVNLLGPSRVAAAIMSAAGTRQDLRPGADPTHLVTVSTAYVAGTHQGEATEILATEAMASGARARTHTTVTTEVDIDAEIIFARGLRSSLEYESRRADQLAKFTKAARTELGAAGAHLLAERAEKLREDWVRKELMEAGRARAQSLGWPDAYAFTKALGERQLVSGYALAASTKSGARKAESGAVAGIPITVVRPSIIESAIQEPYPGWIRGFRMAEPIIISYARGLLREFPGIPEGVIDVIPVDMVVATIIAVAAAGPDPEGPKVFHVASGVRNPFRYGQLVSLVQEWFTEHPIYDSEGQPIVTPDWSFPGRGRVQRQLQRAGKALAVVDRIMGSLPVRGSQADFASKIEEKRTLAERALTYVELYGAYTETEARFRVDRLLELFARLDSGDRATFAFDPIVIDWNYYVHHIHLPSIVQHARVKTTPGKATLGDRGDRARRSILSPERHLAAFDLENTLVASNVVESYVWLTSRHLSVGDRLKLAAQILKDTPTMLSLDRRDRGDFLRTFYRRYEGAPSQPIAEDAWDLFHNLILTKSFPAGIARVRKHRALGHRTVLITGALSFVVEPLRPLFDEVVCAELETDTDGRFTGRLDRLPPTGESRALVLNDYASAERLDLGESIAYADSASDLPLLECVGFPVAVNPEAKLAAIARKRGWHVEHWAKAAGGARPVLPIGPINHDLSRWWSRLEQLATPSPQSLSAGRSTTSGRSTISESSTTSGKRR